MVADVANLERRLSAVRRTKTEQLKIAEARRAEEVETLEAEVERQHELNLRLASDPGPTIPFWDAPMFMFSTGLLVGALIAAASYRLGAEPFP